MFLSKFVRLIKIYYFNSSRIKFSFFFIDSTFIRRFEYALKIVVAFIISGLIAYESPLRRYLIQEYLICCISVLSVQETFGFTLYSSIQTSITIIPLSILLFIIQIIGLSYGHYLPAILLLLILTLFISYQCTQVIIKEFNL